MNLGANQAVVNQIQPVPEKEGVFETRRYLSEFFIDLISTYCYES